MKKKTPGYSSWISMRSRCNNPNVKGYKYYGGRGIKVCERWDSFENFIADMGPRPDGMTIERKDGNGDYTPDNCVWATHAEQARNRRNVLLREFNGERLCLTDIAEKAGTNRSRVKHRLKSGRAFEEAIDPALIQRDYTGMGPPPAVIAVAGEAMTISEASARFGVPYQNLYFRIMSCGIAPEIAVLEKMPRKGFIHVSHSEYRAIYHARHAEGRSLKEICVQFDRSMSKVQRICKFPDASILDGTAIETSHAQSNRKQVRCVETGAIFPSMNAAAASVSGKPSCLSRACGDGSRSYGYHWEIVS